MSQSRFACLKEMFLKRPLLCAAILAVAAAFMISAYLARQEAALMSVAEPLSVVVATRDVAAGEHLDSYNIGMKEIPRRFVQGGAIAEPNSARGRVALIPIRAGSQITASMARLPSAVAGLAGMVPAGRRAFSLGLGRSDSAGGLIRPNDSVDVIATFDLGGEQHARRTTFTIVRDAQVVAVGRDMARTPIESGASKEGKGLFGKMPVRPSGDELIVTVAVTPEEVQELALAMSAGQLALSLLPFGEPEGGDEIMPTTISSIAQGNEKLMPFRKKFREYKGRR